MVAAAQEFVAHQNGDKLELQVSLGEPELVPPSADVSSFHRKHEGGSSDFFLSNIDRILIYTVETVHFFSGNHSSKPAYDVSRALKEGLAKLLSGPYRFMAGRLRPDKSSGRLGIWCNGKGALFAQAIAHHRLEELGDVSHPSFEFKKLIVQPFHGASTTTLDDLPLLLVQVTLFQCGGFVIGLGTNHTLVDGFAAVEFMQNYAAVVRGEGLVIEPQPDRTLLKGRSPPLVTYEHKEFIRLQDLPPEVSSSFSSGSQSSDLSGRIFAPTAHLFRSFPFSAPQISRLKRQALHDDLLPSCSSFDVITAFVWKSRALALDLPPHHTSTVFFAVDLRCRLSPPLPPHFCGNAVFSAHASATFQELADMSLGQCVKRIQDAVAAVTDDYVRSAIDLGDVGQVVPAILPGSFFVAAWWKLEFQNVDFGWGKPFYCGPVVNGRVEFVLLLPHTAKDSCCVYLALEPHQMHRFEELVSNA